MTEDETESLRSPRTGTARRIAVTGSTGLIGSALVDSLRADGWEVRRVVRSRPQQGEIGWDPRAGTIDTAGLEGLDAVVHLAGENVGQRWTAAVKRRIRESHVGGTRLLAEALASLGTPPRVLVSASAVGIYGDRGDQRLDETSTLGSDFLATVKREWEAATKTAAAAGIRVVNTRLGVVLSPWGGALKRMLPFFRLGIGGRVGSGRRWMSPVALPDVVAAIRFLLDNDELSGPVNVTAPNPVTNAEFTTALGRVLGRPTIVPVPPLVLYVLYGKEMIDATLLTSQRVLPRRLEEAGFRFRYPEVEEALRAVL